MRRPPNPMPAVHQRPVWACVRDPPAVVSFAASHVAITRGSSHAFLIGKVRDLCRKSSAHGPPGTAFVGPMSSCPRPGSSNCVTPTAERRAAARFETRLVEEGVDACRNYISWLASPEIRSVTWGVGGARSACEGSRKRNVLPIMCD